MCRKRDSSPPRYREVYAPPDNMTRPCGIKCCKIFLIILNFVFLVTGFAVLGLGIWMQVSDSKPASYMEIFHDASCEECVSAVKYFKVPYILIAIGSFVTLLSFLGCCGAWAESTCLLCLYSMFLFLILVAEIGSAVMIGAYQGKINKCLECSMLQQVRYSYNQTDLPRIKSDNSTHLITLAWDRMQEGLKCCGSTGPQDFYLSNWYNYTNHENGISVPPSCCGILDRKDENKASRKSCQSEASRYTPSQKNHTKLLQSKGCHEAFQEWLQTNVTIALSVLVAVIIMQILDFIASCLLLSRIRTEHTRPYDYGPPGYYAPKA